MVTRSSKIGLSWSLGLEAIGEGSTGLRIYLGKSKGGEYEIKDSNSRGCTWARWVASNSRDCVNPRSCRACVEQTDASRVSDDQRGVAYAEPAALLHVGEGAVSDFDQAGGPGGNHGLATDEHR